MQNIGKLGLADGIGSALSHTAAQTESGRRQDQWNTIQKAVVGLPSMMDNSVNMFMNKDTELKRSTRRRSITADLLLWSSLCKFYYCVVFSLLGEEENNDMDELTESVTVVVVSGVSRAKSCSNRPTDG